MTPVHDIQTRQTIVRLLSSMGSAKEIDQYLRRFPAYRLSASPVRGGRARFRGFLHAPFTVA